MTSWNVNTHRQKMKASRGSPSTARPKTQSKNEPGKPPIEKFIAKKGKDFENEIKKLQAMQKHRNKKGGRYGRRNMRRDKDN